MQRKFACKNFGVFFCWIWTQVPTGNDFTKRTLSIPACNSAATQEEHIFAGERYFEKIYKNIFLITQMTDLHNEVPFLRINRVYKFKVRPLRK